MSLGAVVLGVLNGMTFGLLALGIVLVYKSNRFLNLAYAQLGAVPALLLAKFVLQWGWSWWVAFVIAVAFGVGIGLLVEWAFVARLRRKTKSTVSLLLLSVGIGQLLLAATFITAFAPGADRIAIEGYPVPFNPEWTVGDVVLGGQDVLVLVLAPLLVASLAVFLRYTMLGKQVRAAASNPDAARLSGVSVRRVSALTWGIAGGLSAITAILLAPSQGTFSAVALGPQLLLVALGAAAFGGFTSIPGALVGGLVIGLTRQITLDITSNAGTADVVVLLLILGIILVRGRLIGRVFAVTGSVVEESPQVRVPPILRDSWVVTRSTPVFMGTAVIVAALLPLLPMLHAESRRFELSLIVVFALVAVSLTVLVGWGGQVSLGHFAVVGVGAFVTARLMSNGRSLLFVLVAAGLAGAATLIVVGLPALRVPGLSLAVTTLGLAVIAPSWLFHQEWLSSSQTFGITVDLPPIAKGLGAPTTKLEIYYLGLVLLVLISLALAALRRSSPGRVLLAVRDNEVAAASFGVTPATVKVLALAVSGFIAGLAGVVWAGSWNSVAASQFGPELSMALLAAPVIGGVSSLGGSITGAVFLYGTTFFVAPHVTGLFGEFGAQIAFQLALGGLGVVLTLLLYPSGIAGFAQRWWQRYLDALAAAKESTVVSDPSAQLPLAVSDAVVRFGGVQALSGASIEVRSGEIVGLIGPNGAGKSTLMNVVSGTLRPDQGSVRAFGSELVGIGPEYRPAFGVGRSFQDAQLFAGLTVTEVIQVVVDRRHRVGAVSSMLHAPWARSAERESRREAAELIERFGLTDFAGTLAGDLSTGTRRICDLAAQAAARPQVLLLDEPTAGVAQREAEAFGPLLRRLRDELDCSILIIEHDMTLLMGLCDRIYAMEGGQIIAEGTPTEIRTNPLVVASYLGTDPVAVNRSSGVNGAPRSRRTTKKTAARTPAPPQSRARQEAAK